MGFEALPERLAQVRAELARRAPQQITIVAVTKGFGTDAIRAALDAGLADIGENRVQEAVQKQDRKSTRLNSSHGYISYAVFCLKKNTLHSDLGDRLEILLRHNPTGSDLRRGQDDETRTVRDPVPQLVHILPKIFRFTQRNVDRY